MSNYQIRVTSNSEERGKTNFPFKIKPDCSVYAKEHSFQGTNSSAVELFIEFKRCSDDDPFVSKLPQRSQPRKSSSNNTTPPSHNPLMKTSSDPQITCGQITAYATSHMSAQYRTHIFFVLICSDYARLIRWDRSGAIVTEPTYYNDASSLFDFFILFNLSPPDVRGRDITVRLAKPEDTWDAVSKLKDLKESPTPLVVVSIPNSTGESSQYVVASPLPSLWAPVGRWTRTSIGYDIQRGQRIFLKDSWRLVIEGVPKEGDVYKKFEDNKVPNVPHCSNSGDIGDDKYHSTQTGCFVNAYCADYTYDLTTHRHYRLILDDIGQPLDQFDRSQDMASAVYAALKGKSFVRGVEVY